MNDEVKKLKEKLKKKSQRVRELTKELKSTSENREYFRDLYYKCNRHYNYLKNNLPLRFYEVVYDCQATDGNIREYKELIRGYFPEQIIDELEYKLDYFELTSIQLKAW